MQLSNSVEAVLFDLDGTLLDTAEDLVSALSATMQKPLSFSPELRAAAGQGCKGLLKVGMDVDANHPQFTSLTEQLLRHYETLLLNKTHFFTGMQEVLEHLDGINLPWGIVTNKPDKYTQLILDGLGINKRSHCVISGDSLQHRKPHPQPLLHACQLLEKKPSQCLYIGDSLVDVKASKAAGIRSIVALYGYIPVNEDPREWRADAYIEHPGEILRYM